MSKTINKYWLKYYATHHCTLCGNRGVIDSRGVRTPAGLLVGRLNYCICPNGQQLRGNNIDIDEDTIWANEQSPQVVSDFAAMRILAKS